MTRRAHRQKKQKLPAKHSNQPSAEPNLTEPPKKAQNKEANKVPPKTERIIPTEKSREKSMSTMSYASIYEMVNNAIASLGEKRGSTVKSITKYILNNDKVDPGKQGFFVKKCLKTAIANEAIVKVKSNRQSGKFMLAELAMEKPKQSANKKAPAKKVKKSDVDVLPRALKQPAVNKKTKVATNTEGKKAAKAEEKRKQNLSSKQKSKAGKKNSKKTEIPVKSAASTNAVKTRRGKK